MKKLIFLIFNFFKNLFSDNKPHARHIPEVTEITGPILPPYKDKGPQRTNRQMRYGKFNNRKLTLARANRQMIFFIENGRNTHKTIKH
jgi:hypothetical protein